MPSLYATKTSAREPALAGFLPLIGLVMQRTMLTRAALLLAIATTLLPFAIAGLVKRDTIVPVVFSISPAPAAPGGKVTIEVELDQIASTDQIVTISTSTPGKWSQLPSSVTVFAGDQGATFSGVVHEDATGSLNAVASCNGGSLGTSCSVTAKIGFDK